MTFDASDRKDVRRAEKAAKIVERSRLEVTTSIMSTTQGREWTHDLLVRCHVFQNPFTPDALATAFGCGEMNIGQLILTDIMAACPDQYIQMMREENVRHAQRTAASERSSSEDPDGGVEGSGDTTDPYRAADTDPN